MEKFKFSTSLVLTSIILSFGFSKVFAESVATSPRLEGQVGGTLFKKIDNSEVAEKINASCMLRKGYISNGVCYGNYLTLIITPQAGIADIIDDDEKLFIVIVDNIKKKTIKSVFLSKRASQYGISATVPYYFNEFDIYLYKQKNDEPDFTKKEENCFGKATFHVANQLVYQRGRKTPLKVYNNKGEERPEFKSYLLSKITPNYYSISDEKYGDADQIGEIVLKDSQKNLLTKDQKIVVVNKFSPSSAIKNISEEEKRNWNNSIYNDAYHFDFYIPKEVDEFKFLVYEDKVTDRLEDVKDVYHIKLNKR